MEGEQIDQLRRFFAAMSDETRLRIVGVLSERRASSDEIATTLGLKRVELSRHLAVLKDAGVVRAVDEGQQPAFLLDIDSLRAQRKELLAGEVSAVADSAGRGDADRVVLRNYFDGDRLKEVPASQAKRTVVLQWLAERFETNRRYPEREVNEIIKRHHPDFAYLRRELVDRRFMQREDGEYWRIDDENR